MHTYNLIFPLYLLLLFTILLINYSFLVNFLIQQVMIATAILISIISIFNLYNSIKKDSSVNSLHITDFFTLNYEMSIKDLEIYFCLLSLAICLVGYLIYTLFLLCGMHYGQAVCFLIIIQIIFMMPIMLLESSRQQKYILVKN